MSIKYWIELISESLIDVGISATEKQISLIAHDIQCGYEGYSVDHGYDVADANLRNSRQQEVDKLHKELQEEKNKIVCSECKGHGYIFEDYGIRSVEFKCSKCNGCGRI